MYDAMCDIPTASASASAGAKCSEGGISNVRVLRPAQAGERGAMLLCANGNHHGHAFAGVRVGENARIQTPRSGTSAHYTITSENKRVCLGHINVATFLTKINNDLAKQNVVEIC